MKVQALFLTVDNRRYGPFFNENDEKLKKLMHRKGVEIEYELVEKVSSPRTKRKKRPENLSMLEMMGFIPRRKGDR